MKMVHGRSHTNCPLYYVWKNMRNRCNNKNNPRYKNYGGRGITVCKEWESYVEFENWAVLHGYTEGSSLDRIDNDRGYYPENCRWTSDVEQARNKSNNVRVQGKLLVEIADEAGLSRGVVYRRYYHYGIRTVEGLSAPIRRVLVDGKTLRELSNDSGIDYGTIKSRYYRGARTVDALVKEVD